MKRPITLLRSGWRVVCMTLVLGGVMLTQAGPTTAPTIKVTPLSAHLTSPVGPVEDTAAFLFDRDTTTETALTGPVTIEAALDVETEIRSLKIYGEGVCTLTVRGLTSSGWQIVAGPSTVTLGGSGHGWLSLPSANRLMISSLRLDFAPIGTGGVARLKEIECWGAGTRTPIKDGNDLFARMSGPDPPGHGRKYVGTPATGTIGALLDETPDDPADNSFVFTIDRDPHDFKHAYLAYEAMGLGHWIAAGRSLNGHRPLGGIARTPTATWSTQVEELNPDWLRRGENQLEFQVPDGSGTRFAVRNVQVLGELENGSNFVSGVSLQQSQRNMGPDPGSTGDLVGRGSPSGRVSSALRNQSTILFDKGSQVEALALNITGALTGTVNVGFLANGVWSSGPTINGAGLTAGWNEVAAPSYTSTDGVRVSYNSSAGVIPPISDIVPLGSGVGRRWGPPRLHITYPDAGQFTGREAYIRGFLTPASDASGPAQITIGSTPVLSDDGGFEGVISKDDAGLQSAEDAAAWSVDVKASYPGGQTVTTKVVLDNFITPPESIDGYLLPTKSFNVSPGRAARLEHDGASLRIGPEALTQATTLRVTPLGTADLAELDQGMDNVTRGPRRGYRLQPHGMRFSAPIQVSIPYDKNAIPSGLTEDDVRTFYFDEQAGSWKELERLGIDPVARTVTSLTDHFTDIINATVTVPDHPQPLAYSPTTIKDIKVADPGAGIQLIEPPGANHTGDARLSYPIELPQGRAGMQPRVEVLYDSSHANGWLGVGWDILMQAVTIDTRWGVPHYDPGLETETYVLEGEQLTPVAHRGALVARAADKSYHTRVEGRFHRVVRHGHSPDTYWWEVTDKEGTRFFYGGDPDLNAPSSDAVLADPSSPGSIFKWMLREVRDTHGNTIRYHYDVVDDGGSGGEPWRQIYLRSIRYSGAGGAEGPYEITFHRVAGRSDVMVDGRPGFKTVLADCLASIDVSLLTEANPLIRRYTFEYETGPFSKTLLTRITEYGEDGVTEFNHHSFEYFDEVTTDTLNVLNGFHDPQSFGGATTVHGDALLGDKSSSALSADDTGDAQLHFYGGIAVGYQKEVSGGFKVGADFGSTTSKLALLDINGDGLPDQVYQDGSHFFFRPNTGGPQASPDFGAAIELTSLTDIGRENRQTFTLGAEGFAYGVNGLLDVSFTRTSGDAYMSDVNGDGLPDLVLGGSSVFFNHLETGVPTFGAASPIPLAAGATTDATGLVQDPQNGRSDMEKAFHLVDPIRRWSAPYDGTIAITGQVRLAAAPPSSYKTADGVRVSIQHDGAEIWTTTISDPTDLSPRSIVGLGSVAVSAGDDIYFRVHAIDDGSFDAVEFNPTITYNGVVTSTQDENGMPIFVYSPASDYSYGARALPWAAPFNGTANLSGQLIKPDTTTDDVSVEISQNGVVVYRTTFTWNQTGTFPISVDLTTVAHEKIQVRVDTDSRIDLSRIRFAPILVFKTVEGNPAPQDGGGNPLLYFYPPVTGQIYPQNASTSPYSPIAAPSNGTLCVQQSVAVLGGTPPDYETNVTLAVKRPGHLLAKQRVEIRGGAVIGSSTLSANIAVQTGDLLYFTVDGTAPDTLTHVSIGNPLVIYLPGSCASGAAVPFDTHVGIADKEAFGGGFRRWSTGQYNGRDGGVAIDEGRLRLPTDDTDTITHDFLQMVPFPHDDQWRAEDKDCWIDSDGMSASRLMVKHLQYPDGSTFGGGRGVTRYGGGFNASAGVSALSFGGGVSHGNNWSDIDFFDFNGDRYPDLVGGGAVQSTLPNGALGAARFNVGGFGRVRESTADSFNVTLGATTSVMHSAATGRLQSISTEQSPYNVSVGITGNRGEFTTNSDLVDVNGDDLPDFVQKDNSGLQVRLNLGYRFGAQENWGGSSTLRFEKSQSHGISAGVGFTLPAYSYGGGIADTVSDTGAQQDLVDLNGDGLIDIVSKSLSGDIESTGTDLKVRFNTGNGFMGEQTFMGALPRPVHGNETVSRNLGLHFTIPIPIPFTTISIILNPGFYGGENLGGAEVLLADIDGDGYADHVFSDTSGTVEVHVNAHGRTNLLKTVRRPLGAVMDFDYARSGDTTDQPGNRWVLSRVSLFDGYAGDGVDQQLTTFVYEGGRHDRAEREFYGFRTVTEEHRNPANGNTLYRSVVRTYRNGSYYDKGLLEKEVTRDDLGRSFVEIDNTYDVAPVADGAALSGLEDFTETRFPRLVRTDRLFYEGQALPGKSTLTTYDYDAIGNVIHFLDTGDPGPQDDVEADITYFHDDPSYIVGKAAGIVVRGNGVVMRQRASIIEAGTGNVLQVRRRDQNGQEAVTDLEYSPNGNLRRILAPANLHGQRYTLTYEYDPVVDTHIAAIQDSFGYRSTATFKTKYAVLEQTTDVNGQATLRSYDGFGRVIAITGPYEIGGASATISFDYHPEATVPYAVTRHIDSFRDAGDFIETVLFTDGLKRVLQTKKDGTVHVSPSDPNPPQVMVVSGRLTFDHVGRTVEHFYPITETKGPANVIFNTTYDPIAPTRTLYDVLDRPTRVTVPDNTSTSTAYGFGPDRDGVTQFEMALTDANGNQKKTYRNVRDLITGIKEFNKGGTETLWTSFVHDPLKELITIVDDRHNTTRLAYDNLGRRTLIDSPDGGRSETRFDLAGNATAKITANLSGAGQQITYDYDFNRLRDIVYPDFPGNNVTYTYGSPGAPDNRANRIVTVQDQSGVEERFYGRLGEIVKTIRTVASDTQGASANSPEVYVTEYVYDTWGRLQRLTYPDTEVVTYSYDAGGLVRAVTGVKAGYTYPYVTRLEYDKFEDRVFTLFGNGTRTISTYNPANRRLANLQSQTSGGGLFQNLKYTYDDYGNILGIANVVPVPPASDFGGPTMQSFAYDDLYRLTAASGSYQFAPNKVRQYTLQMEYNGIHNILSKQQTDVIVQPSGVGVPQHKTSYEFDYAYGPDGGARPHAPLHIGARTYTYDADGNQTGWTSDVNGTRRSIVWDDENRIQSVADNGHVKSYKYDDTGERIIKTGPQGETVYVNPYFTIRNRSVATKHVFVGTTRMVSKLVYQENRSIGGSPTVPPIEKDLYFYHGDQVGSSNFVTDAKGNLYEHLEYMPFGESWVQESTNTQRTPYLFTAKELDEETGLYEMGARSYDPRTSVWQSADPGLPDLVAADAELLRVPRRLAMYTYALQNPVIRTDPDGKDPIDTPLPDVPEYKLTPPSFLVPPTQHISLLPPNALKLTPPTLTPVVTGPLFTVPPPSLTPSLVPPQGTLVPVNPLLPFPPSGSGSSSTGSATTPALPDRLHVFTAGPLDVGGRLGFPSLPDNPTLTEMNRQAAIYTQLATGKVPSGFDAVDKAALAKAVWGIFSTYIAPDFARNLSSSLSRPTPTTGVSYEIDGVLFTDSLGAGISLTLRH